MNQATAPPASDPGLLARAIGVLFSPRATFEKIVQNPKPVGILFVLALVVGLSSGLPQFTETGRQAAIDISIKQQESFRGRALTADEYARVEQFAKYTPIVSLFGPFLFLPIFSLIVSGLFFVAFNAILGGTASFKQVLAIVTHSQIIWALDNIIRVPFVLMQGTMTMAGPFNLGALVPFLSEGSFLARFLGATSVFTLWSLLTYAIGFSVLYRRKTRNIAITLAILYIIIVGGLMLAFSPARTA